MLIELSVRNLAIIDDVRVALGSGLNVLTGETGAGKSLIVNALSLVLGARADATVVRAGAAQAEAEAVFDLAAHPAIVAGLRGASLMDDADANLVVRRVVLAEGRSRAYIGGRAATVAQLVEIGARLVSIFGQHDARGLLDADTHLDVLDEAAGLLDARAAVAAKFARLAAARAEAESLRKRQAESAARADYLDFVVGDIDAANLHEGEDAQLVARRRVAASSEKLAAIAREIADGAYEADGSIGERAGLLARRAADAASIDETFAPVARLLDDVVIAAQEAGRAASDYLDGMTHDPRELEHIDERLETVRRLAKKYGGSLADVLAERARAADERASLGNLDAAIKSADDAAARAEKELAGAAAGLSKDRRAAAKKLAKSIDAELADMAMNGAHFDVAFIAVPDGAGLLLGDRRDVGQSRDRQGAGGPDLTLTRVESTGAERAEFLLAANPGEPARPLARVASGGELSRVMLAIKNSLARAFHVPTLIFDEVDQGLGGAQAEVVGRKLASVAQNHQVLCITHLPRIAGLADRHLVVAKEQAGGRTVTRVREVAKAEREDELARMVGGVTITNADRAAAREMLAPSQSRVSAPEKKRAPRQAKGG